MSKRDWDGQAAPFVITIIGLAVIAFFSFTYMYSKGYQSANEYHAAYRDSTQIDRDEQRAQQDLNAQREMADWAESMFWATVASVAATVVGIYFVRETLKANRDAVDAANRAVEVTREIGKKQLRAYITVKEAGGVNFKIGEKPKFIVRITNSGTTPAKNFRMKFAMQDGPTPKRPPIRLKKIAALSRGVIGPGQGLSAEIEVDQYLSQLQYEGFVSEATLLHFGGVISYKDIFGTTRRTVFRFALFPSSAGGTGHVHLQFCERNNGTT